ncbi:MAG: DUF523 domain-containing protein [Armatimonadetes bacterium]|nr:DUF523 domain-containing protein [Armatimonadota bacterium]
MNPQRPVIVSACLTGEPCRYDGGHKAHPAIRKLMQEQTVVPVCPEELGGLGTPRAAAGLEGGDGHSIWAGQARVVNERGEDVTSAFCQGASRALDIARECGAHRAILKARSPSCGCGRTGGLHGPVEGDGVFSALLRRHGLELLTEEDLPPS